jgi:hypothetical protein
LLDVGASQSRSTLPSAFEVAVRSVTEFKYGATVVVVVEVDVVVVVGGAVGAVSLFG